ncbi:Kinase, NEK [Giardia muris]|uniref:Kinase, NEK n=1 Tax=Giardia muris TaxID=5742 RepID=A0A4Z1SNJ6_GIAMU|nr:Kinase, NEK [Giardia muris]|eukprot:TNJ27210.1 Kinase, NEK [Giardia muris]
MPVTALMRAARKGDLNTLKENIREVAKVDGCGETALMKAAFNGHVECIPFLEEEIGTQNSWGWTALMKAVYRNHTNCAPLLEKEVGMQSKDGRTALMLAAMNGHPDCISLLEEEIGIQDNDGWTALMKAALLGHTKCVRLLLSEAGKQTTKTWKIASPNGAVIYPPGTTALMLAAQHSHPEIVELLLPYEQGIEDSNGYTAKWHANNSSWGGDFTRVRELLENEGSECISPPPKPKLLRLRGFDGEFTVENDFLEKDLSLSKNVIEEARKELFQVSQEVSSLQKQLTKTSEDLIRSHTEPESFKRALADQKAQNPALENENTLLKNGSLIPAAIRGDLNTLRRHLDQAGKRGSSGMTALMHAASRGQTEVVRLLRPLEARLQDGRGWTALMHAVRRGHEECVGLLLLERDLKDGEGRTAAEHAEGEKMRRVLLNQPTLPRLPESLSGYRLTAVLGRDAFGTVYAAHGNGRNVAVKVVSLGGHNDKERELLRGEVEILPSLDHPNVLRCLETGEDSLEDLFVLVTDFCCGDLRGEMDRRRKARSSYSDQEVWKTIREVAAALTYLHGNRIVHRDLKPANILLSSDGRCVLGGFEVAKVLGDSSRMSTYVGTLPYMAPEILRGENYDKSVDVWALGVVGYEMCTHALPFENVAAVLNGTPAPSLEGRPSDLADLISRMLSKDPEDRPTARDVLEEAERHQ